MVRKSCGQIPVNNHHNVVHKVIQNPIFVDVEINDETHGLLGYLFFSFLYTTCRKSSHTNQDWLADLGQDVFATFGPKMLDPESLHHIHIFLPTQTFLARTHYLPHVKAIATKVHASVNDLYLERTWEVDPEDLAPTKNTRMVIVERNYFQSIELVHKNKKRQARLTKEERTKAMKRISSGKTDLEFCSAPNAQEWGYTHVLKTGKSQVCIKCGLVVAQVYEQENTFDDDGNVVLHMSKEEEWKPSARRYDVMKTMPKSTRVMKTRQGGWTDVLIHPPKSAVDKHRETFVKALGFFNHLPPEFKVFMVGMWDMCIEGYFSPSIRLSAKILVGGYMVWRATHPRTHHFLDFEFKPTDVQYYVLDDHKANSANMPTLYLPQKMIGVKYQPTAHTHYASPMVEKIATMTKAIFASNTSNTSSSETSIQRKQTRLLAKTNARVQAHLAYVRAQTQTLLARAKGCPADVVVRVQQKVKSMLDKANTKTQTMRDKAAIQSAQVQPSLEFEWKTNFYHKDVTYVVGIQDANHITMLPKDFNSPRVDLALQVSFWFKDTPSSLPEIEVVHHHRCAKIKTLRTTPKTLAETFFVENFSSTNIQIHFSHSLPSMDICLKLGDYVVKEVGPKNRARVSVSFVPIPLVLQGVYQRLNKYLANPMYSPVRAVGQLEDEDEETYAPKFSKVSNMSKRKVSAYTHDHKRRCMSSLEQEEEEEAF